MAWLLSFYQAQSKQSVCSDKITDGSFHVQCGVPRIFRWLGLYDDEQYVKTIHERKVWCVSVCVCVCVCVLFWAMYIATVTCECLQMLLTCCISYRAITGDRDARHLACGVGMIQREHVSIIVKCDWL